MAPVRRAVTAPEPPRLRVTEPALAAVIKLLLDVPIVPEPVPVPPAAVRVRLHPEVLDAIVAVVPGPVIVPVPPSTRASEFGTRTVLAMLSAMAIPPVSKILPITIVPAAVTRAIVACGMAKPPVAPVPMYIAVDVVYGCRVNTPVVGLIATVPVKVILGA